MDQLYDEIKGDYIFPQHHVLHFQLETSFKHQVTDSKLFDELYARTAGKPNPPPGHQDGHGCSTFQQEDLQKALVKAQQQQQDYKLKLNNLAMGEDKITQFVDQDAMRKVKEDFSLDELLARGNPLQQKYYDLTRVVDENIARELKPDPEQDQLIEEIINQPDFLFMGEDQKTMIFRFRYSLIQKPKALVKFLQSARLNNEDQQKEAMKLFNSWCPLEKEDALPLLSIKFAANQIYNQELVNNKQLTQVYTEIRAKAVKSLEKEIEKQGGVNSIKSILLQLV